MNNDDDRIAVGTIVTGTIQCGHLSFPWNGRMQTWDALTERDRRWYRAAMELEDRLWLEEQAQEPTWRRVLSWFRRRVAAG